MNWFVLGGALLIVCGIIWLIKTRTEARALPPRKRASVWITGATWILLGIGILLVDRTHNEGATWRIGVALIVVVMVMRIVVGVALRAPD
jgi:uncharacterized membrane protein